MNNMKNSVKNVLHMESITMQFGGVVAVNGLTLDVNELPLTVLPVFTSPPLVLYPLTGKSYWPIRPRARCAASTRAMYPPRT